MHTIQHQPIKNWSEAQRVGATIETVRLRKDGNETEQELATALSDAARPGDSARFVHRSESGGVSVWFDMRAA